MTTRDDDPVVRDTYKGRMDHLKKAMGDHIVHRARTQGLTLPPYTEHAAHPFLTAWRHAVRQEPLTSWQRDDLGAPFVSFLTTLFRDHLRTSTIDNAHHALVNAVEQGNIDPIMASLQGACETSGFSLYVGLRSWVPEITRYDPDTRDFLPLTEHDIPAPRLHDMIIPCPSGQLWLVDTFRSDAWNKLSQQVFGEHKPSINYAPGRLKTTSTWANTLGIARVYVGNTCPSVVVQDDTIRVGHLSEEHEDTAYGSVTTDLWWVTAVDPTVLRSLFIERLGMSEDEATNDIERLAADSDLVDVRVTSGDYHLYYADQPDTFARVFDRSLDWNGMSEPMMVFSKTVLEPLARPRERLKP